MKDSTVLPEEIGIFFSHYVLIEYVLIRRTMLNQNIAPDDTFC